MEIKNIEAVKKMAEQDSEFLCAVCEADSESKLIDVCKEKGIILIPEEAAALYNGILAGRNNSYNELELSEEDLENVAGGFVVTWTTVVLIGIGLYAVYEGGKALGKWAKKTFY